MFLNVMLEVRFSVVAGLLVATANILQKPPEIVFIDIPQWLYLCSQLELVENHCQLSFVI